MFTKCWLTGLFFIFYHVAFAQSGIRYHTNTIVINQANDTLNMPWAGGLNSPQFNSIDLDGDGDSDLAIFERASNRFKTFRNTGSAYIYDPSLAYVLPDGLDSWVLMKDYNCDGRKDIFTNTLFGIRVLKNVGTGAPAWEEVADPIYTIGLSGQDINLQVNGTDIPAIEDVDGDGDLDILVYNFSIGGYIRYHKNLSQEQYNNCEELVYQREASDWGQFEECECDYFAFDGQICEDVISGRVQHAGGKSMLLIDLDNDQDKDLIMSQEDCNKLYYLENKGTQEVAYMNEFSMQFPEDNPVRFNLFPAAYYEDVTFDGSPDLLVAPNLGSSLTFREKFSASSWLYEDNGGANGIDFQFRTDAFLQNEMIEAGENSHAVNFDVDGDGDRDLLVAGNNYEDQGMIYGSLDFYENIGNQKEPVFQLMEKNFLSIGQENLRDLQMSVVNLNNDIGSELVISGSVPFSFNTRTIIIDLTSNSKSSMDNPSDPGDKVLYADIDGNGLVDVLVGKSSGRLEYYKNQGSNLAPVFVLEKNEFAGIEDNFLNRNLFPAVADIDQSGISDLITVDDSGLIRVYRDIFSSSLQAVDSMNLLLKFENDRMYLPRLGKGNSLSISRFERGWRLWMGTADGGVTVFDLEQNSRQESLSFDIYPNPAGVNDPIVYIAASSDIEIDIISLMGSYVYTGLKVKNNEPLMIDTSKLAKGIYIVQGSDGFNSTSEKLLVWR